MLSDVRLEIVESAADVESGAGKSFASSQKKKGAVNKSGVS